MNIIFALLIFNVYSIKLKLKIGTIGNNDDNVLISKIFKKSMEQLVNESIIDQSFDIELIQSIGCNQLFEGVASAAKLYHIDKIDVFFGPYCSSELSPVASMASYWDVPLISYTATSAKYNNDKIYKTLIRTSFLSVNQIADATAAFITSQNWSKVAIVSNLGIDSNEKLQIMESSLKNSQIDLTKKILIEDYYQPLDLLSNGIMTEIKSNARIIIVIFSSYRNLYSVFQNATLMAGMQSSEFVYIFPQMIQIGMETPIFYGKKYEDVIIETFPNSIMIYDGYGYDNELNTHFKSIFDAQIVINEEKLFNYVALYESFQIFAQMAKDFIIKNREEKVKGKEFYKYLMGKKVNVMNKLVEFDNFSEKLRRYKAFYVDQKHKQITSIASINSHISQGADLVKITVEPEASKYWHSTDGSLPADEPDCGFNNEKCDYTKIILLAVVVVILSSICLLIIWTKRICDNRSLAKMSWRIWRQDVQLLSDEQVKSMVSLNSESSKLTKIESKLIKNHAMIGVNTHAVYDLFEQRQNIRLCRNELALLTKMKQAIHDNVNPFIGLSFNENNDFLLLWKYCSRGTLQDILYCDKFVMDEKFHGAFVRDITMGLEYLHSSPIGYHGNLSTWTALIDKNWMIKLTDYALLPSIKRWEKHGTINTPIDNENEKNAQRLASLYVAPEIRTANEKNRKKRMDQKWHEQTVLTRKASDIYAFGIIIYEILFRSLPFEEKTDLTELANKAAEGEKIVKPNIQRNRKLNPDLIALLQDCWSETPSRRPTIRRMRTSTETALKTSGNLVDSMMRMMEEYANNLEKLVAERTKMAVEANTRAERLLYQLLPKNIAQDLKNGKPIPPRSYSSATVMFSDIVGFTKICSSSTPIEVVNLLNALYSEFDHFINKHDAYKVETIGDAYMVVSGIPEENGDRHVANISNISLEIIELLKSFQIPHKKSERLRVRFGFASGPIAAAVIGLNSPRYCLFGETVNLAAIMESSGEPGRIQITDKSKQMLEKEYPEFIVEIRGINKDEKLCPDFVSFWLIGKDLDYFKKANVSSL